MDGETGEVLWSQHYASDDGLNEAALAVTCDSQNNVFIAGRATVGTQGDQMLTMKLDASTGNILWSDFRGGDAGLDDIAWDIVVGPDDHPIVTGYVISDSGAALCLTRKLSSFNGSVVWSRQVSGALDNSTVRSSWLALMDGGDVVMCQRSWGTGYDTILERYAANNGDTVWDIVYDGPTGGGDDPKAMVRDSGGQPSGGRGSGHRFQLQLHGAEIRRRRRLVDLGSGWLRRSRRRLVGCGDLIAESPDGTVIVSGLSDGSATGTSWDMTTVAYDGLWVKSCGPTGGTAPPAPVTRCGIWRSTTAGDIFVTGYGYDEYSGKDMVTLALQASVEPVRWSNCPTPWSGCGPGPIRSIRG